MRGGVERLDRGGFARLALDLVSTAASGPTMDDASLGW
jgi:hypothetical protein